MLPAVRKYAITFPFLLRLKKIGEHGQKLPKASHDSLINLLREARFRQFTGLRAQEPKARPFGTILGGQGNERDYPSHPAPALPLGIWQVCSFYKHICLLYLRCCYHQARCILCAYSNPVLIPVLSLLALCFHYLSLPLV